MWKPGQLVTIYNKVYRVTKRKGWILRCTLCAFKNYEEDIYPCNVCLSYNHNLKMPSGCYLKKLQCK